MSLTAEITHILRILEADSFGTAGRTTTHRVETQKMTGATRHDWPLPVDARDRNTI
jgi:hypothetical protein